MTSNRSLMYWVAQLPLFYRKPAEPIRVKVRFYPPLQAGQARRIIPDDCAYYGGGNMKDSHQIGQEHRAQQKVTLQMRRPSFKTLPLRSPLFNDWEGRS